MGTKWKSKNGQYELFDGHTVEHYEVALGGKFDPDEISSDNLSYDDHVCLIVMAKVDGASIKANKDGEMVRRNTLRVLRAVQIAPDLAEKTLEKHASGSGTPQLPLYGSGTPDEESDDADGSRVNSETGEVAEPVAVGQRRVITDEHLRKFLEETP